MHPLTYYRISGHLRIRLVNMRFSLKIMARVILIVLTSIIGTLLIFHMTQGSSAFVGVRLIKGSFNSSISQDASPTLLLDDSTTTLLEHAESTDIPQIHPQNIENYSLDSTQESVTSKDFLQSDPPPLPVNQGDFFAVNNAVQEDLPQSTIDTSVYNPNSQEEFMESLGNRSHENFRSNGIISLPIVREAKAIDLEFIPFGEGYEKYLDDKLFKKKYHKICPQFSILNYREDGEIIAKCEMIDLPLVHESPRNPDEKFGDSSMRFNITMRGPDYVVNNSSEYVYAQCQPRVNDVILRNIFKPDIAEERANRTRDLIDEYNKTDEFKPLTVVVLVLDSVSRQNFFRNMQNTIEFFNEQLVNSSSELGKHFAIYDFLINHSVEPFTVPNMVPILYGKSKETMELLINSASIDSASNENLFLELQKNYSVWEYYKSKGFVTMLLYDSVSDYLSKITGRKFATDHTVFNFWNLAKQYFAYNDFDDKDMCIGRHMPHVHSLKYLSEYLTNYQGYNRFSYLHINTGHELSRVRIAHADKDFAAFFEKTLQFYKEINEDIVFLFMSDHGASSRDFATVQAFPEQLTPYSFIISNKDYIHKHQFHNNLMVNLQRLSSRYDWHKTLKHLAITPYKILTVEDEEYQNITTIPESVSLLLENVPYSRTCEDAGINFQFCLSKSLQEINTTAWDSRPNFKYFVEQSIFLINKYLISKISTNCRGLVLDQIERIQELNYEPGRDYEIIHYFIEFTVRDNPRARFLIHGGTGYQHKYSIQIIDKDEFMDSSKTVIKKTERGVSVTRVDRIWSISRIDVYYNETIDHRYCENSATYKFNLIKAETGENCQEKCKAHNLLCVATRFKSIITDYMQSLGMEISYRGRGSSIELQNNEVVVGSEEMCSEELATNTTRLCNCVKV